MSDVEAGDDPRRKLPVFLESVEVAAMLRVSERTLENWRLQNKGPKCIRLGKGGRAKVLYNLDVVLRWVEEDGNRSDDKKG